MKERIDNSNKLNQMVGDAVLYLRDSDEELKKKLEAMKGGQRQPAEQLVNVQNEL